PPGRGGRDRGADGDGVDLDAAAAPAGGLYARRPTDRHDGAPRRYLGLRGFEGSPGVDLRGGPAARARGAWRRHAGARGQRSVGSTRPSAFIAPPHSLPLARIAPVPPIGETLREARMRQRLDITDVEAQTKIRAKYLRALENEDFGMLPGSTFVKSFLRTYAEFLRSEERRVGKEGRARGSG